MSWNSLYGSQVFVHNKVIIFESHHPHLLATLFSSGSKNMQNKVQNNVVLSNIAMQNKCLENMVAVKKLNANYIQDYNLVSGNNWY